MKCPFKMAGSHWMDYECEKDCAIRVSLSNGKTIVCGLIASQIVDFVGFPAFPENAEKRVMDEVS